MSFSFLFSYKYIEFSLNPIDIIEYFLLFIEFPNDLSTTVHIVSP